MYGMGRGRRYPNEVKTAFRFNNPTRERYQLAKWLIDEVVDKSSLMKIVRCLKKGK